MTVLSLRMFLLHILNFWQQCHNLPNFQNLDLQRWPPNWLCPLWASSPSHWLFLYSTPTQLNSIQRPYGNSPSVHVQNVTAGRHTSRLEEDSQTTKQVKRKSNVHSRQCKNTVDGVGKRYEPLQLVLGLNFSN